MKYYKIILLIFAYTLLFNSCVEDEPDINQTNLVIEGKIESGDYPIVSISTAINPNEESKKLSDAIIKWGKVSISDGDTTIILTGSLDKNNFPPYTYRTFAMKGTPGKKYKLSVEYKDLKADAISEMLLPTAIDSATIQTVAGNDTLRAVNIHITSHEDKVQYYRIYAKVLNNDNSKLLPSFMGTHSTGGISGHFSFPVFKGKSDIDTTKFVPQFSIGDTVEIRLCRMEKPLYDFWTDYDNIVYFGNSQFISTNNSIRTNISGGYGYWAAYGMSRIVLVIN